MRRTRTQSLPWVALVLILLLAATTRILYIDAQSLWIDEGFTYYLTQYHSPLQMLQKDVHPPLYFLLADLWVGLTGITELAMRYLSVLPSLISIAVVYQIAREIERQRHIDSGGGIPTLAALMMALADAENFLAQEMRSYTWHVLLTCLSMWGFLRWVRTRGRGWHGLWFISTVALVYTFYLGAWIGVVQGLISLIFLRRRQRLIAVGTLVAAALTLVPWLLLTLGDQSGNLSYANWIKPNAYVLDDLRRRWFTDQWALMLMLAGLGLVVVIYGGERVRLRWRPLLPVALLTLWLVLPVVMTFALNEFAPLFTPRRITQITPAVALLVAFGLGNSRPPVRGLLVVAIVIYGVSCVDFWRDKQDWRSMAHLTAPLIKPDDLLMVELGGDDYAPVYHYTRALPDDNTITGLTTWRHLEPETYTDGLPALIASYDGIWFFYWSSDKGALDWLDWLDFRRTAAYRVDFNPDVTLYRYDRLPNTAFAHYDNGLTLHDAQWHSDGRVDLWWSLDVPVTRDYVVSVQVIDRDGQLIAQQDAPPYRTHYIDTQAGQIDAQQATSQWPPDTVIYQPVQLALPDAMPADYRVQVVVYAFVDGAIERLPMVSGQDVLPIVE